MTRYLRRLAPLGGLVAAAVVALSAAPASATVVCPPGVTPPSPYCSNVKPGAVTNTASSVKGTSATLNGAAGARVTGGDPTQWFFKYGTSTAYGKQTPTQTLGSCPAGISPPSVYCTTPASQGVTANVSGLTPCTTYHFQIFANNPDTPTPIGGGDKTFKTGFAKPLKDVKTPKKVKHGKKFQVKFTLLYNAKQVKIFIKKKKNGHIVTTYNLGALKAGKHAKKIKAPNKKGEYKIEVHAKLSCGSQSVTTNVKVH